MIGGHPREPWRGVCFGPAVIAGAALVSAVAGTAISAVGAVSQGQAASEAAKYQSAVDQNNAIIAQQNAQYATAAGTAQAAKLELQTRQQVGAIRAAEAAGNVDVNSGSPLGVQSSQQLLGEMNVATIRNQAQWRAYGAQTQASSFGSQAGLEQSQAGYDATAGTIGGVGSILSGASSVGSSLLSFQRYGVLSGAPKGLSLQGGGS